MAEPSAFPVGFVFLHQGLSWKDSMCNSLLSGNGKKKCCPQFFKPRAGNFILSWSVTPVLMRFILICINAAF